VEYVEIGEVVVRNMDKGVWRKFRAKAVERGITAPVALEEAILLWLENQKNDKEYK